MLCHVWPGITPMNARTLSWRDWVLFAELCDLWVKSRNGGHDG